MKKRRNPRKSDMLSEKKESFFKNSAKDRTHDSFFKTQPKLEVSQPGDPQEKQADAVAQHVVSNNQSTLQTSESSLQRQGQEEEMAAKLQRQEEEEVQTKLQRQEEEETQARLQRQEEEETQAKLQPKEDEEEVGPKLQRQEEEEVQAKVFRKEENISNPGFATRLDTARAGGSPLPDDVREEMELKMNASFRQVRIHTDEEAQQLCEDIRAQAFTRGNHIYFNEGKYQPHTASGKFLLAHELTHVLQQRNDT